MRYLYTLLFLFVVSNSYSQTYISIVPLLTNDIGNILENSNLSIEIGRQYDCFSIGFDIGKTTLNSKLSKDIYFELRPNLNVFQQGKWTNTLTFGVGYLVNNTKYNQLTELTSGIEYSYSDKIHMNIYFGQFFYSGEHATSSPTFFGVSIMRYFLPYKPKSLIIKQ